VDAVGSRQAPAASARGKTSALVAMTSGYGGARQHGELRTDGCGVRPASLRYGQERPAAPAHVRCGGWLVYTQSQRRDQRNSGRCRGSMSSGRHFRFGLSVRVLVAVAAASVYLSYELVVQPRRALQTRSAAERDNSQARAREAAPRSLPEDSEAHRPPARVEVLHRQRTSREPTYTSGSPRLTTRQADQSLPKTDSAGAKSILTL